MATRSRRSEPVHTRTPIEAERGVCAGGHPAVADAGVRLMQEGGNAIDALVGAAFTAFVVEPAMCGLGGYARISVYAPARGGFLSFDAYARAPLAAAPDMFEPDGSRPPTYYGHPRTVGDRSERGILSIAAPGAVAGCCDAHAMLGRLPLAQVMAPAIEAAQQGIEIAWFDLLPLVEISHHLDAFPDTRAAWMPGGAFPRIAFQRAEGDRIDGAALAGTLRRIAARGKRGFYAGRTAKAIDAYMRSHGGTRERRPRRLPHPRAARMAAALPRPRLRHLLRPGRLRGAEPARALRPAPLRERLPHLPASRRGSARRRVHRQHDPLRRSRLRERAGERPRAPRLRGPAAPGDARPQGAATGRSRPATRGRTNASSMRRNVSRRGPGRRAYRARARPPPRIARATWRASA